MTGPLGEALHLLRLSGTLYCRADLTAPWGIAVPDLAGSFSLVVVTAGGCWLETGDSPPRHLRAGSLTLLPHGTPHVFRSAPGATADPLFDLPVEMLSDCYELLSHGGGGELTQVTYGVLRFGHTAGDRLTRQLPEVLHLDGWDADGTGWLHSTLRLITQEAQELRPGGETVLTRLADILVIQAIRSWLESAPEARRGWLAALRDEQVGQALAAIHRAPGRDWSLVSLAREAGMSRSAFAERFTALVGEPAMRYLTDWRMQSAHAHLRSSDDPLPAVAHRFGYQSEAAFGRAFKRAFGVTPGSVRTSEPWT